MSRSAILKSVINQQLKIAEIEATEEVGAVLTLTRTAAQALTTAGTIIIWQSAIRNFQFTWAGSGITIPSTGWYLISCAWVTDIALTSTINILYSNSVLRATTNAVFPLINGGGFLFMRYFTAGDVVEVGIQPNANCNLVVRSESINAESPILHIVQLTGGVG